VGISQIAAQWQAARTVNYTKSGLRDAAANAPSA